MYPYHRYPVLIFLFAITINFPLYGAVFTVTSKADAGPGTLREAVMQANANGVTGIDYIYFNLPGLTLADRTIILDSDLPDLSGNLVIDGTTQPGGKIGVSDAKVLITTSVAFPAASRFYAFRIVNAADISFYGLCLKHDQRLLMFGGYGIYMNDAVNIRIGAPGKGNLINGFYRGIAQETGVADNITIQGNIIGLDEDGQYYDPYANANLCSVEFKRIRNLLIGGATAAEGNVILGQEGIHIEGEDGRVEISFNKLGTDYTGTRTYTVMDNMINLSGNSTEALITDNQILSSGIYIFSLKNRFTIQRNRIGTDPTGTTVLSQGTGINILDSPTGLIGGDEADKNIIAGVDGNAIRVAESYHVTISKNQMFCNGTGIALVWYDIYAGRPAPYAYVTGCTGGILEGIATPLSKIEVFETDECRPYFYSTCEGKKYLGTVTADAAGHWSYNGVSATGLIVTATDSQGATSEFSYARLDVTNIKITHTGCGKNTGSITGIKIISGMNFYWKEAAFGTVIGHDTSAMNLWPGTYFLGISGSGCDNTVCMREYPFVIMDVTPSINTAGVEIIHASCGQKNGLVRGLILSGENLRITWKNAAGATVGTAAELTDAGPGAYTLEITDTVNVCSVIAGPYEVVNQTGPAINVANAVVANATCSAANGSITGITVSGATGTVVYSWTDQNGILRGSNTDLLQAPPGKYVLTVSDEGGCPPAGSDTFTIHDNGLITIDETNTAITPANCRTANGGISGIVVTGAETYNWIDEQGQTAGTSLSLTGAAAGNYQLQLTNSVGCTASTGYITVPDIGPKPITADYVRLVQPTCNEANGEIRDLILLRSPDGFSISSYRWVDASGNVVATTLDVVGLPAGSYTLYVIPERECEQMITTVTLAPSSAPEINTTQVQISDDRCGAGTGRIEGLTVTGAAPITYSWYNGSSVAGNSPSLTALKAGDYYLVAEDANGCRVQSEVYTVANMTVALQAPVIPDAVIIKGMDALLQVQNKEEGIYHLYSTPDPVNTVHSSSTGDFTIRGLLQTTSFYAGLQLGSCHSPLTKVKIEVIEKTAVYVPTAFSPNGDGNNDLFRLRAFGLSSLDYFSIFNRWGQIIFSTQEPGAAWDGTLKGQPLPAGTYTWIIKGKDINGKIVSQKGAVTLIR